MSDGGGDAGEAFDRAAARLARREEAPGGADLFRWNNERRYRAAIGRFVLVLFLLPAHIVAVRAVTIWMVAHLVLLAILASKVVTRWLARRDGPGPFSVPSSWS